MKDNKTRFVSSSEIETLNMGVALGRKFKSGLICFYGELGAGKTTLIRGLAKSLGISARIQSPTFTYQRVHKGKRMLYHFDFYRLEKPDGFLITELYEALENKKALVVVEWAERVKDFLPEARVDVRIEHLGGDKREIIVEKFQITDEDILVYEGKKTTKKLGRCGNLSML